MDTIDGYDGYTCTLYSVSIEMHRYGYCIIRNHIFSIFNERPQCTAPISSNSATNQWQRQRRISRYVQIQRV